MTLYRGVWMNSHGLTRLTQGLPILPSGFNSASELESAVREAVLNFGSLRMAALHHLTGATGVRANEHGRPIFTFWTRIKSVALNHLLRSFPGLPDQTIAVLLETEIDVQNGIVVAADEGLYRETIADFLDDTFADFEPEDEVFVSIPIRDYRFSIVNLLLKSTSPTDAIQ